MDEYPDDPTLGPPAATPPREDPLAQALRRIEELEARVTALEAHLVPVYPDKCGVVFERPRRPMYGPCGRRDHPFDCRCRDGTPDPGGAGPGCPGVVEP